MLWLVGMVIMVSFDINTGCPANLFPPMFFCIAQFPRGLEIPSWTFFNSSLCVDFKKIHFVTIWSNLDQDIAKIPQSF